VNFSSKFNIGDALAVIRLTGVELPPVMCSACNGSGKCELHNETFQCPKCKGKTVTQARGTGYVVTDHITVRYIRAETPTENCHYEQSHDGNMYAYMSNATGGGSVYREEELWPPDDALAECDRRNGHTRRRQ
jgi:DnaJ-class molecular chaperone